MGRGVVSDMREEGGKETGGGERGEGKKVG